jgi:hypothetical protein
MQNSQKYQHIRIIVYALGCVVIANLIGIFVTYLLVYCTRIRGDTLGEILHYRYIDPFRAFLEHHGFEKGIAFAAVVEAHIVCLPALLIVTLCFLLTFRKWTSQQLH